MRIFTLILTFLLMFVSTTDTLAQAQNFRSRSEVGVFLGGAYYIGDLNRSDQFKNTKPAIGLLFRHNPKNNARIAWRLSANYGSVEANDANSRNATLRNRNLNFKSEIYEIAGGLELHYFPFRKGHDRYKATAYILAEIGLFQMNPKSVVDGKEYELRGIGTEGQGSSLTKKNSYSKTQLVLPIGFGAKFSLGARASFNLEFGLRKTFTDYLDDVHNDSYVDPIVLAAENGPLAARIANQSLDGDQYGYRGNSRTKDWYVMFGAMLTFRLGSPDQCKQAN
jgi:hypothetical protein